MPSHKVGGTPGGGVGAWPILAVSMLVPTTEVETVAYLTVARFAENSQNNRSSPAGNSRRICF